MTESRPTRQLAWHAISDRRRRRCLPTLTSALPQLTVVLCEVHSRRTELTCTKLTQLDGASLVTRVSVTKFIGYSSKKNWK